MIATTICVAGLGYVGLPLALHLAKHFSVIGFDVKEQRVQELQQGKDASGEISREEFSGTIEFTTNPAKIKEAQFVIACVPTPVDENNKPDLRPVESVSQIIGRNLAAGTIVVYESTVYPGVTEDLCVSILEKESGLKCGKDFFVGYSPERVNPGDKSHSIDKITKIVSGMDEKTLDLIDSVYGTITKTHRASSIKVAEAAKVIENIQRDLNIALMNELAIIFDKMKINVYDVLAAAGTKWNFHQYQPGLVGGHCFEKKSLVIIRESQGVRIEHIGSFVESLHCRTTRLKETTLFYPNNVQVLSYDVKNNTTSFQKVSIASKRAGSEVIRIRGSYNYHLDVTEKHPVVVYDQGLKVKLAKDVSLGDKLVLSKMLPSKKKTIVVDMLEHLPGTMRNRIRVKIKGKNISYFRQIINNAFPGKKGNFYNWDYLPLEKFFLVERKLGISRKDVLLCTGRGPGMKKFPCLVSFDKEMARLLGYYLSEGCITFDKSLRTRFIFHRKEKEYISDVQAILRRKGIDFSVYEDKTYQSTVTKVSSTLFGLLLRDIWRCGTNCYTMQVPWFLMEAGREIKKEVLKGLFRGDGGVTWYSGARTYHKAGKEFTHENNSITVSFFSSSKALFQQVVLLLLHQDILPKLAKREGYLTVAGPRDVAKVKDWFLGEKKKKVEKYLKERKKDIAYPYAKHLRHLVTLNVISVERGGTDVVYSLEVPTTNTIITSQGIIAHNCIGVDPYYLTHKAQQLGYEPEVILAGRRINDSMHEFYTRKIMEKLNGKKSVHILGLTFKPNVSDARNSRVKHLIKELQNKGITVSAFDPYLSKEIVEKHFGAVHFTLENLPKEDDSLIVIATPHQKILQMVQEGVFAGKEVTSLKEILKE